MMVSPLGVAVVQKKSVNFLVGSANKVECKLRLACGVSPIMMYDFLFLAAWPEKSPCTPVAAEKRGMLLTDQALSRQ